MPVFPRSKRRVTIVVVMVAVTMITHFTIILYIVGNGCLRLGGDANQDIIGQFSNHPRINSSNKSNYTRVFFERPLLHPPRHKQILSDASGFMFWSKHLRDNINPMLSTKHFDRNKFNKDSAFFELLSTSVDPDSQRDKNVNVPSSSHVDSGRGLPYDCSTLSRMKLLYPIGRGVSKQTFVAKVDNGMKVAVKMVTRHIQGVKDCLDKIQRKHHITKLNITDRITDFNDDRSHFGSEVNENVDGIVSKTTDYNSFVEEYSSVRRKHSEDELRLSRVRKCYLPATSKLMREIILSMEISHPNMASLLGFCVRNEEYDSTDMKQHGVVAVFELGSRFHIDSLQILPWQQRIQHALEMAELLVYLENSPLGSLIAPDLKEGHLIMVKEKIKLIDLDDFTNLEPECRMEGQGYRAKDCELETECIGNSCEGFNAKKNLHNFNVLLFKRLLFPLTFPESVIRRIGQINARLDSLSLTAKDLRNDLLRIMNYLGITSKKT